MTYKAEGGTHAVDVSRFEWDPRSLSATFHDARLTGPKGHRLFEAGLVAAKYDDGLIVAQVDRAGMTVERSQDGSFDVVRAIPVGPKGQHPPAFQIKAYRLLVRYVDSSKTPTIESDVRMEDVTVNQDSGDFWADARLSVPGFLPTPARAQVDPDGRFWMRVERIEGDAARLVPVLERFFDPKDLGRFGPVRTKRFMVQGSAEIALRPEKVPDVRGDLRVSTERIDLGNAIGGALTASVSGSLSRARIVGQLRDAGRTVRFDGVAGAGSEPIVVGNFEARLPGNKLWPIVPPLPQGAQWRNGTARGRIDLRGEKVSADGRLTLASAGVRNERIEGAQARFVLSDGSLSVAVEKGRWRGGAVTGVFKTDLKTGALIGGADLGTVPLTAFKKELGVEGVTGSGRAKALFAGKVDKPVVALEAHGSARYAPRGSEPWDVGAFEARVQFNGTTLQAQRLTVSGQSGFLSFDGKADLKSQSVTGDFVAGGLPLRTLSPDAHGTLFARGGLQGTFQKPVVYGRVEGYGVGMKDLTVAQVVVDVQADRDTLRVAGLRALSGTGNVLAEGEVAWATKKIKGSFQASDISLSEFLDNDVLGQVDVTEGVFGGTYDDPTVQARIGLPRFSAYGVIGEGLTARTTYRNGEAKIEDVKGTVAGGSVSGTASFRPESEKGTAELSFTALDLGVIGTPSGAPSLDGRLSGTVKGFWTGKDWTATGSVDASQVAVNGTPFGSGQITVDGRPDIVTLTGEIGSVDRFVSLRQFSYEPESQRFSAEATAYNLRLQDLFSASKPYWDQGSAAMPEWLQDVDGSFSGTASVKGDPDTWTLSDSEFTLNGLIVGGRDAGELKAKVSRTGSKWAVPMLTWKAGESSLTASGEFDEAGPISGNATLTKFDLGWIRAVLPDSPPLTGEASATAVFAGTKDDPTGRATLLVTKAVVEGGEGSKASEPVQVLLDDVSFGNRRLTLNGQATYLGFTGAVSGVLPYSALEPDDGRSIREPLSARLAFGPLPISEFRDYLADIDVDKSSGQVELSAQIDGFWDKLHVSAFGKADAEKLYVKSSEAMLNDVHVTFSQKDRIADLDLSAKSGLGGAVTANVRANLADIFSGRFSTDALLDESSVRGTAKFDNVVWRQKLPGATTATSTVLNGALAMGGPVRSPRISGDLDFEKLVLYLPQEFSQGGPAEFPVDPRFDDLTVRAKSGTKIETGIGTLQVVGIGKINGSMSELQVNMPLTLEKGSFRLPSSRISLEPGGKILVNYGSLGGGEALTRIDLDLEGRTTVVSRLANGQYEPYVVNLEIQGNALDENNLRFTAASDPPGLSQEEILALIGQRDLIQGLAQGVLGGSGDSDKLREALYSVAVPSISQNLTQGIAQGLDLDYFLVDYNPFDQFVLSAGKTLAKGLTLHVTKQLQGTQFGPPRYEVKLEYRLPVRDDLLSRFRIGLGFDQNVPYKVTLSWSKRF